MARGQHLGANMTHLWKVSSKGTNNSKHEDIHTQLDLLHP